MTMFGVCLVLAPVVLGCVELCWDRSVAHFLLMRMDCNIRIRFREFLESYRVSKDRWRLYESYPFAGYGDETVSFTTIAGYLRYRRFSRRERRRGKQRERNDETEGFRATLRQDILDDLDAQYKKWVEVHDLVTSEPGEKAPDPTYFIPIHDYNSDSSLSDVPRYVPARYENGRYYIIKGETERR